LSCRGAPVRSPDHLEIPAAGRHCFERYAQIVLDTEVGAEQAPEVANIVRAWLVREQIIEQEGGHRPGINYRAATKLDLDTFRGLAANGVKFAIGRHVFDAGGDGIELGAMPAACPSSPMICGPMLSVRGSAETISSASPAPQAANRLS
jgi:hypothetical protein